MVTGTPIPVFFQDDVVKSGWTMISKEVLCGMFGAYLKDGAVAIRK